MVLQKVTIKEFNMRISNLIAMKNKNTYPTEEKICKFLRFMKKSGQ